MSKTLISWTDETANPLTGCNEEGPECLHCYARIASASPRLQQFEKYHGVVDEKGRWTGQINFAPDVLDKLLHKKKPCKIFMPSMSDMFHPGVKDEWIDQIMATIAVTPHITYQCLTKRPERMLQYFKDLDLRRLVKFVQQANNRRGELTDYRWKVPFKNLWLGVTAGTQKSASDRIPLLLQTPAAVRFVSIEPILEEMDLKKVEWPNTGGHKVDVLRGGYWEEREVFYKGFVNHSDMPGFDDGMISQIIIGGESGLNSRPFHMEWAQSLMEQCQGTNTKVFMKQVGSNAFYQGEPFKTKSRAGLDPSEWPEWAQIQEFPNN